MRKPKKPVNLHELREEIVKIKEEGNKILSHYRKLEEYYDDWQDRLYKIEKQIQEVENELGLNKEEIEEYDALADALN